MVGELLAADVVLARVDRSGRPRRSGALGGKPIVIVSGRGLSYGLDSGNVNHQFPALNQLFAESMQMTVFPVLAELTLTDRVPDLAAYAPQRAASLAAAEAEIDRLLDELG